MSTGQLQPKANQAITGINSTTMNNPISPARLPNRTGKVRLPTSRSSLMSRKLLAIKTHIEQRPHTPPAQKEVIEKVCVCR